MLDLAQFMNLLLLHKEGHSIRELARRSGHSRNTVRRLLRAGRPPQPVPRARPSQLDPFKAYLRARHAAAGLSAVRLWQELVAQGFGGSVIGVRRFLRSLAPSPARVSAKLTVRYETPPGHQAQCDWAEVGRFAAAEGRRRAVYLFIMILSYSRLLYIEFTTSMNRDELIGAHQRAFSFFGGVPATVLYDNMKQVMRSPAQPDATFADFAAHCGFAVRAHRPYRPRTKGKVERAVGFVKEGLLRGRHFAGLEELRAQGRLWLQAANGRVHATTGWVPHQAARDEAGHLQPWPPPRPWTPCERLRRKVDAEALVHLAGSRYSVPA